MSEELAMEYLIEKENEIKLITQAKKHADAEGMSDPKTASEYLVYLQGVDDSYTDLIKEGNQDYDEDELADMIRIRDAARTAVAKLKSLGIREARMVSMDVLREAFKTMPEGKEERSKEREATTGLRFYLEVNVDNDDLVVLEKYLIDVIRLDQLASEMGVAKRRDQIDEMRIFQYHPPVGLLEEFLNDVFAKLCICYGTVEYDSTVEGVAETIKSFPSWWTEVWAFDDIGEADQSVMPEGK